MVGTSKIRCRNMLYKFLLYFKRSVGCTRNKSKTMADSKHMSVYWHCRLSKRNRLHNISCLATYTRQLKQAVKVGWHFSHKIINQHLRQLHKMTCLGIGIAHALYILVYLCLISLSHRLSVRIMCKQLGCYLIDTLVGTLRTKHNGYKQLKYGAKLKLGCNLGMKLSKIVEYVGI